MSEQQRQDREAHFATLRKYDQLREALRRYGSHDRGCPRARIENPGDCTCGWLAALEDTDHE
jgi:hypothetical protein